MGPPVFKTGVRAKARRRVRFPSASATRANEEDRPLSDRSSSVSEGLAVTKWSHAGLVLTVAARRRRMLSRMRRSLLAVTASFVIFVACAESGQQSQPTASPPQTATPTPSPSPSPSPSRTDRQVSFDVPGFTTETVPANLAEKQLDAIRGSVQGVGKVIDSRVEGVQAESGGLGLVATVVEIKPASSSSTMEVFAAIVSGAGLTGKISRAVGGQGYKVVTPKAVVVLAPLAVEPNLIAVIAIGPKGAPVESFVKAVLEAP